MLGSVLEVVKGVFLRQLNSQNAIGAEDLATLQGIVLNHQFRSKMIHSRFRGKFLTAVFATGGATPQQNAGHVLLIMTNKSRLLLITL